MIRTRICAAALLAGAAALALSACSSNSSAGGTSSPKANAPAVAKDAQSAALLPARFEDGINVASDIPFAPMEMFDANQKITGFDYDLGQALGAKLGVPFKFETQAFDSIIPSLQSGKHQIIMSGMNDTPARQKTLDFVDYFHGGMAILVKKGNPDGITTVLDLCGKTVAVEKATVQGDLMKSEATKCTAAGKSPIRVSELPSEGDAQLAVRAGKATADVLDAAVAEYNAKTAGDGNLFEIVHDAANPTGYSPVYTGIGLLKKDNDLAQALQSALKSLIDDGTYKQLLARYNLSSYGVESATMNHGS
jgi:polar amino acid transport system substrate-binding protein